MFVWHWFSTALYWPGPQEAMECAFSGQGMASPCSTGYQGLSRRRMLARIGHTTNLSSGKSNSTHPNDWFHCSGGNIRQTQHHPFHLGSMRSKKESHHFHTYPHSHQLKAYSFLPVLKLVLLRLTLRFPGLNLALPILAL